MGVAVDDELHGGIDSAYDTLTGGTGADKFEQEVYWVENPYTGWVFPKFRDIPTDFNAAEGDVYI
jgi:hypothetical protein